MAAGTVIDGTYVVERQLGEGGMGVVLAARHIATQYPVALKVLKSVGNATHARRFVRELRGTRALSSPHVARVYGAGVCGDGRPYIAMELLDGPDLQTMLAEQPLSPPLAAGYIIQACAALSEAHRLGIIHRDIKPANLMLSHQAHDRPIIKLVDFGIATPVRAETPNELVDDDEITAVHAVIGSAHYMSPEAVRSARDVDARADVWSLGVTLYELISGRLPFTGANFAEVAIAITEDEPAPLVEAAPALRAIVARCLAKDRDRRYPSAAALAAALAPFALPGLLPQPAPRTRWDSGERWQHRAPAPPRDYTRAWVAVAVAALALLGFSAMALGGDDFRAEPIHDESPRSAPARPIVTPIRPT
jgi:serine/threonine-protein kinase